jgi:hypothetical protein
MAAVEQKGSVDSVEINGKKIIERGQLRVIY